MSQNVDTFTRAAGVLRSVADRVPAGTWDNQSCCTEWSAREVAGHAAGVVQMIAAAAGAPPAPEGRTPAEIAGDDPAATIGSVCDAAVATLASADLDKVIESPFGEMPLGTFIGLIWVDTLAHSWDIADATGIDHGIDSELATLAYQATEPIADAVREFGGFGAALDEPDGDPVGAFIAFTGRTSARA